MTATIEYANTTSSTKAGIVTGEKNAAKVLWAALVQSLADAGEDVSALPAVDFEEEGDAIAVFARDDAGNETLIFGSSDVKDIVVRVNDNE